MSIFDTTDDLLKQVRLGEDSALELKNLKYQGNKVSEPHRNSMADDLAAMANSATGVFVLGVDDKTKTIVGIPTDKLDIVETWVRSICNDLISPPLLCIIRKIPMTLESGIERVIMRIDVARSINVHRSPGGYFHGIGSWKREMSPDYLARLFQQRSQVRIIRFDEQSVSIAPKDCLKKKLWEKFRPSHFNGTEEEFLLKLRLLTEDQSGTICPTVSGILMACEAPHEFITNAFIQAVKYRGTERNAAYQVDARDITGPLDVQIAEAFHFVKKNMQVYAAKEPARKDLQEYSFQAIFEALVNAVAHRDYSIHASKIRLHMFADRLELFSPGAIPNSMTIESLPLRQASRNELLTSLLAKCPIAIQGYDGGRNFIMDKRGEGVPIILAESERISGLPAEYTLPDDAELMLTIYAASPLK